MIMYLVSTGYQSTGRYTSAESKIANLAPHGNVHHGFRGEKRQFLELDDDETNKFKMSLGTLNAKWSPSLVL